MKNQRIKNQLIARWNGFSDKEKSMLMVLAIVMLSLLFYAFAWLPVEQGRERLLRTNPDKQAKLLLMRSQAADIEHLRGQYQPLRSRPDALKAAIEVSAKLHGLTPGYQSSTKDNNAKQLAITLTQIGFDTWIKWVESLQSQHHIRVHYCRIVPDVVAGQVRVEAILTVSESR